ncbi:hypothetical protein [Streptomyces sp. G45]|uniref:hypothetical protein n=1 Tax=Streptomyces sp. G45 TaxID=3406627 RepID=UPI003C24222F
MKSAVSRVVVTVSVAAALGLTAACGEGDGDGGDGGRDGGTSSTAQAKPEGPGGGSGGPGGSGGGADEGSPAARRLAASALAKGDVDGYAVGRKEESAVEAASAGAPVKPSVCRPLWDVLASVTPPKAKARVSRTVVATSDADAATTDVQLFAYADEGAARQALREVRTATRANPCGSFRSGGLRFSGVTALPAPDKGDEAVAYRMGSREQQFQRRNTVTVVRKGVTLVSFAASNQYDPESVANDEQSRAENPGGPDLPGTAKADDEPTIPTAVVDAQLKKLK